MPLWDGVDVGSRLPSIRTYSLSPVRMHKAVRF